MATDPILRLRRSAAQLHALVSVERQIRATDGKSRCRYLRDFSESFREYQHPLSPAELDHLWSRACMLLIGDYHALPASQLFAAGLLQRLASGRPVVLGLEAVFSRHQSALDDWMRGDLDETELRERLRFDLDWGYDWTPYRDLLLVARQSATAVYGLDCPPRGDLRRIAARDHHAAARMASIRSAHPEAVIVGLIGESHLAPTHLPSLIHEALPSERVLCVLQNVDPLYWKAAGEPKHVSAVQVRDDVVCVFNSTPLEKYESYRLCLERWSRQPRAAVDLAPSFYNLIDALLDFLNLDKYSSYRGQACYLVDMLPEVICRPAQQCEILLRRKGIEGKQLLSVLTTLRHRGVCFVPFLNSIFASRFTVEAASEAVARFVHRAFQTSEPPALAADPTDSFYVVALSHALADFGSRVLFPARPAMRELDLYAYYAQPPDQVEEQTGFRCHPFMQMIDFLVLHKDYELNQRHYLRMPELILEGLTWGEERFDFLTRRLGLMLGSQLYDAYLAGRIGRRFLRSLFVCDLASPGLARTLYFDAARRSAGKSRRLAS